MNVILFEPQEISAPLPRADRRARHLLEVLRRSQGDAFDAGLIDGPLGRGRIEKIAPDALTLSFIWGEKPPPPDPVFILAGLPRPQTARKLLSEGVPLGVASLHFFTAEKTEPGYSGSKLWTTGEWRRHLVAGAEQAFTTRLPEVTHGRPLADVLKLTPDNATLLALDNYEAPQPLSRCCPAVGAPVVLALGPERGWSAAERDFLRAYGFLLTHLGRRVLRVETAAVAAVTLIKAQLGLF